MSIERTALAVVTAWENAGVPHMVTGPFAYNSYGIPRSTKDFDIVLAAVDSEAVAHVIDLIGDEFGFGSHVQFDTPTWGRRHKTEPGIHRRAV